MYNTKEVLAKHLNAGAKSDVDQIVSDYSDQAVLVTMEGTFKGKGEIRSFFEALFNKFTGLEINLVKQEIFGEKAYIVWKGKAENWNIPLATDTLFVEDGKIAFQTFAAQVEPA